MYFRTYYTAIPLNSYGLSGNLADFTGSVYDSFRWYDIFFPYLPLPVSPLLALQRNTAGRTSYKYYGGALGIGILLFAITTLAKGGFKGSIQHRPPESPHLCASTTSMYTVFGSLCYDLINQKQEATPQIQ